MNGKNKKTFKPRSKTSKRRNKTVPMSKRKGAMSSRVLMKPTVQYHANPIPNIMITKFKYNDYFSQSSPGSIVGSAVTYRLNSPYDPLHALGGVTASGWNAVGKLYQNYIVTGCYVTLTFTDPSHDGMWCGIRFRQQGDNSATGEDFITLKNTKQTFVKPLNNTGSQHVSHSFFIRPWVLTSGSKEAYMDEVQNSASTSAVPINDYILMDVFSLNTNATASTVNCSVQLTYITKLWNPVYLPQSSL